MSEKIKVSREVAEAIEWYEKACEKNGVVCWEDDLIYCHSHVDDELINERAKPLAKLSSFELARVLVLGYEIERTPEEIVSIAYSELLNTEELESDHYAKGIKFTLDTLGIKIKGVNDR